jgi:ABC-type uncharacterized transport system substrate-binding protein
LNWGKINCAKRLVQQGFKDGLKELGYSVDYSIMNAGQDRKELRRVLSNEIEPKLNELDYVYTFGTTVSKMTKSLSVNNIDIWPILYHIFKQVEETDKIEPGGKYGENSIMGSL